MRDRIEKWLGDRRVRTAVRWLLPVALTCLIALLLSPGLAGFRAKEEPTAAPRPERSTATRTWDAELPGEDPTFIEGTDYAALTPSARGASDPFPSETDAELGGEDATNASERREDLSSSFDCIVEPWEVVEIGSPITGVIEVLAAERSDFVEAGQVVAELESRVEKAAVSLARERAEMEGRIKARAASLSLGERRNERVNQLFEQNTLSLDLREQAQTEAEIARLELEEAHDDKRLAGLELRQAMEVLNRRTIRSPISGVVVERLKAPGEVVDEETILTIAQIDPLRVEVILPSALYGAVEPGMRAAVEPEFPGDRVHVAAVKLVDRVIDAASGTFGVRLELPNPDHAIPGGLHCQVRFLTE